MRFRRRLLLPFLGLAAAGLVVTPAGAIHLFPLVPGDPGGDCAAALQPAPGGAAGTVDVGAFTFTDSASGSSTTEVAAGDSVTWTWSTPFCHSVTFQSDKVNGTHGGPPAGLNGDEPQLVKPEGSADSFTATFDEPGPYDYFCVHHASVGMTGTVVVG